MLEKILKMYVMYMRLDVRSPMPHLVGPPGCGKSTVVEQAAEMIGVNLHVINVSRLNPLDLEGVQMPHGSGEEMALKLLPATFWTSLKDGDIILFDEFLRGFPEVYNGLLDIFTSRRAGPFVLPKVFIIGASNSTVAYDKALEDRLLHLPVPDPRKRKGAKKVLAELLVNALGLHPKMVGAIEMENLLSAEVLPMYDILDQFKGTGAQNAPTVLKGHSLRNLIGQALLREVQVSELMDLLTENNRMAMREGKPQFVFIADAKMLAGIPGYEAKAEQISNNPKVKAKLTDIQAANLELNLQLIEMERIRHEKGTTNDDVFTDEPDLDDLLS